MPSPFPGMDPYLEARALWESFHNRLIATIDEFLTAQVQPHFYVEQQSTVYIVEPGERLRRPIEPDLYLVEAGVGQLAAAGRPITRPTIVTASAPAEIRQRYLEVRDAASRAVVTIIELLSPANKTPGHRAYDGFLDKRSRVMASGVHWLEIDLLRAGERPAEVAGQSDYYALLKRGDRQAEFAIWFVNLRDPLPVAAVPLRPPFADIALDLQEALTRVFDRYYAQRLDYAGPPPPPRLAPADAAWVEERVREWHAARLPA